MNYIHINEPISIGSLKLESRIIMPPLATRKCDENGLVPDELCDYYSKRAANPHVQLIITEHSYITLQGKANAGQISLADDNCMEGLRRLTDSIHKAGALTIPKDTVYEELKKEAATFSGLTEDQAMIMAMYLLGFSDYNGFRELAAQK